MFDAAARVALTNAKIERDLDQADGGDTISVDYILKKNGSVHA